MEIKLKNIAKSYRNALGKVNREVLKGLNLDVFSGEKIALVGPSGSGKTTLLNIIGSLDRPDEGNVIIGNHVLSEMTADAILSFRNNSLGFIFQSHQLLPQCTLWENVLLPTLPQKTNTAEFHRRAEELLHYMGVWEQRFNKPEELSGGECQRAAVARALINQPQILLADEPTGSLDAKNAELLLNLLLDINKNMNITLIIATHATEIAKRMDKIYELDEGKLKSL